MESWDNSKAINSVLGYLITVPILANIFVTETKLICITMSYNLMVSALSIIAAHILFLRISS